MASSLYDQLNANNSRNDASGLLDRFNQFRNTLQGDPQAIVQQLLQSGRMTQEQYNQLSRMAFDFQKLLRKV